MVVTLDQLRALRPRPARRRATRPMRRSRRPSANAGWTLSPAITRRPGEAHYIIRNGGNTRLAICASCERDQGGAPLPHCVRFRPWPARGEIVALTGRARQERLRGGLTFIERALGIERRASSPSRKAARRCRRANFAHGDAADGYPVPQIGASAPA